MRFLLYGLPGALLALILASAVSVSMLSSKKKNEMSSGMLGEPATLNPIQAADSSAGDVTAVIFNGLLKYDENLEVAADLAKSYTVTQTTTIFFKSPENATTALATVNSTRDRWEKWKLSKAEQVGNTLVLSLNEAGMFTSEEILALFDQSTVEPLTILRIEAEGKARDGIAALKKLPLGQQIIREWYESDSAAEITISGDQAAFSKDADIALKDLAGKVAGNEGTMFLAEPVVDFVLRDDVRWHDGMPFTSKDVLFTYNAIMDDTAASPRKPDFLYILRVETPGLHQARVVYRRPFSPALTSWMIGILPAHILDGKTQEWWIANFNRNPIGTGPYKFHEWKTNEYLRVVRNPDYFNGPGPWLDSIVFRILPDQLSLRLAFETRQVDYWGVDPWAVTGFEKDERFQLFSAPGRSYTYIGWNLRRPIFQDERVRQALAYAVNVPEMVKYILYGHGVQSTGIFTPQMWFFDPNVAAFVYDPKKAAELLAEAGWVRGKDGILAKDGQRFTFTLITNNANEIRRDIATLVQDNLKDLGIEVNIELYEWAVFIKNFINKANFDATVLGWQLGPDYDQYQIWHSSQTNPEQLNVVGYKNAEVDKLLSGIRQEYNREKIIKMAGEMQEIIYRQQPYLFLYVPQSTGVLWKDSYRIRRPDGKGGWIDSPIEMTKAGWTYYQDWFYRPEYANLLPK